MGKHGALSILGVLGSVPRLYLKNISPNRLISADEKSRKIKSHMREKGLVLGEAVILSYTRHSPHMDVRGEPCGVCSLHPR